MGFAVGRRRGLLWDDALLLDEIIKGFPFNTTGKNERDFENGFSTLLLSRKKDFNSQVIAQIDKSTTVESVYCFGKKHRPDLTLDTTGIAIELKFVTYAGIKDAIGQGYLYRLRYKFVFLILIISEKRRSIYEDINMKKEKDLEDILALLAENQNIMTYIVPAFDIKKHPGMKKVFSYLMHDDD